MTSQESHLGKVYLVGAGPGAPGLLTLRGRELLGQAEVVVYDALVNPSLLRYARPDSERIDAGKRAGEHRLKQEETNALLVEKAKQGRMVVRLKGGDPFLFGRGGEEAAALEAEDIPYEVVPGVSSAYAVPAYGGIALTKRGMSSAVHIFTAHGADDTEGIDDWRRAARAGGTLVFLMGFRQIDRICGSLLEEGMAPDTPVAVIQWGTTVFQRQVFTNLREAPKAAKEAGLGPPAIVVVGDVGGDRYRWTECLPFFGRTIGFTRDARRTTPWFETLEGMGARVLDFPLVRTSPLDPGENAEEVLSRLQEFDWIVFTNSAAIDVFFDWLGRRRVDARSMAGQKFAAVGPTTAVSLAQFGIQADLVPDAMTQEGLAEELPIEKGTKVLLPSSSHIRDSLQKAVAQKGGETILLPVYETIVEDEACQTLIESLRSAELDFLVIQTPRPANILAEGRSGTEMTELLKDVRVVCLGRQAAKVLESAGRPADDVLPEPTLPALIKALEHLPG